MTRKPTPTRCPDTVDLEELLERKQWEEFVAGHATDDEEGELDWLIRNQGSASSRP